MLQREYIFTETAGSTNTLLKQAARGGAPLFRVICAGRQTAGRGRTGRSFFSPAGGIYFSASYPFEKTPPGLARLTLLAGLTVCRVLEAAAPLTVKWPNDIMLHGKKVCGILTETVYCGEKPTAILGVGINASLPAGEIPPPLREKMTSFTAEGLSAPPVRDTVRAIVSALDREVYENNALAGDFAPYLEAYRARDHLIGKPVSRTLPGGAVLSGVAAGISASGGLLVRTEAGETAEITFGEVETG